MPFSSKEYERQKQHAFYESFLPRVDNSLSLSDIYTDYSDGVVNGNILEMKDGIGDLNAALFQAIKYLSSFRVKGKSIPATIILVDLKTEIAYLYESKDYLKQIEKAYFGGASKHNQGFTGKPYKKKLQYGENDLDAETLIATLKETKWTKIHLDENCIVGWAMRFYREKPNARKEDFIGDETGKHKVAGEIRNPDCFKDYIYPYKGETNIKFQYLMDKLNDTIQKKNLGAFYTPIAYAKKSHELLRMAIERVPEGNDYIILDRCAGTGNLQRTLTDEELSHCVVSTLEYYEYKVLQEVLGDKVRHIIPPVETPTTFNAGLVRGSDALSKEFIDNEIIQQYIQDPKCTIILFENPPFAETTSVEHQRKGAGKSSSVWKKSYVVQEMKKEVRGAASNELGNAFIWSGFKYYLRQSTDSYIVYSPVKYWKVHHLIDKQFLNGFAFNRRWFHANIDACISAILWGADNADITEFKVRGYDIDQNGDLIDYGMLPVKRIYSRLSDSYYDKTSNLNDVYDGVCLEFDGIECHSTSKTIRAKRIYNENIIGYLVAMTAGFDNPDLNTKLLRAEAYNGNGFSLRKENYFEKLPLFCAGRYITYNRQWTERARIMKSADGADRFFADLNKKPTQKWLRKCLLFTCLEMQNHMRSFTGSDGRFYRNELCLDTTNGETIATRDLDFDSFNKSEKHLLEQWNILLDAAKQTEEYNPDLTYGVYQMYAEIDTSYEDESGDKIYNNLEVHSALQTLKQLVKAYYNKEIVPNLFKYEFLK